MALTRSSKGRDSEVTAPVESVCTFHAASSCNAVARNQVRMGPFARLQRYPRLEPREDLLVGAAALEGVGELLGGDREIHAVPC